MRLRRSQAGTSDDSVVVCPYAVAELEKELNMLAISKVILTVLVALPLAFAATEASARSTKSKKTRTSQKYGHPTARRSLAQASYSQGPLEKQATPSTIFAVNFTASTGIGFFQDIQTPVNQFAETRADGSVAGLEGVNHTGLPIDARLNIVMRADNWSYSLGLNGLYMSTIDGPAETRNSSYARLSALQDNQYHLRFLGRAGSVGGGVEARRSMYRNVSSGHYVDTISPRLAIVMGREQVGKVEVYGSKTMVARLSYQSGLGAGSGAIPSSFVDGYDAGIRVTRALGYRTSLRLEWNQEAQLIDIADTRDYDRFGLNTGLAEDESGFHQQSMLTNIVLIGLARGF